jgi:hypothetical protein
MVLFFFYQLGSWATKYKKQLKESMDATVAHSSVRSGAQVLAVSLVAVLLSLFHAYYYGAEQAIDFAAAPMPSRLTTAVLAHHAVSLHSYDDDESPPPCHSAHSRGATMATRSRGYQWRDESGWDHLVTGGRLADRTLDGRHGHTFRHWSPCDSWP